jgi:glycosyltransferase involved in cell wall biosynthesis
MPSSIEGWGIVVVEANACATPAIAYDVPGLRDCIVNSSTGFVVDDDASFANRLTELLTGRELLASMSQNAYEWATRFSWAATAEHTLEKIRRAQPWRAVFEPGIDDTLQLRVSVPDTGERAVHAIL